MSRRFRAVVLDLFDTLVRWDPQLLPVLEIRGRPVHSTIPMLLPRLRAAFGDALDVDAFLDAYHAATSEIAAERERTAVEVTCLERFRRALARLAMPASIDREALAADLRRTHMACVRAVTTAPAARVEVVRRIAPLYRLGLLSNFDDADTGRAILQDTTLAPLFEAVVVSAEVAVRKPHPAIFREILDRLRLDAAEALFVGDTPREDVVGAQSVGMPVAWLSAGKEPLPPEIPAPDFVLRDLCDLPTIL